MSSSSSPFDFTYHALNFFYDDEDSCALTALINNVRFHVIADADEVRKGSIGKEYDSLLQDIKQDPDSKIICGSSDSGVDVSHDEPGDGKESVLSLDADDAEEALHRWMLAPLQQVIHKLAPRSKASEHQSLEDWYTGPTHFFNLEAKSKKLHAVELESSADLDRRISSLLQQITIPKYISNIDVPWFKAKDLTVLDGSSSPPPYHPARVRTQDGNEFFIKLVEKDQPQPTKREISHLNRIATLGLHDRIQCPRLEGLVTFANDRSKIMGFLQTDIPYPVPLTTKLDTEVPQQLRDRWASESQAMKDALHENDIVWGDAKADNFMVDVNDQLWIIDFGGSYTEGWVDPEMSETVEGDDMGVEKIANALHDPVANVWDPDTDKSFGGSVENNNNTEAEADGSTDSASRKRKVEDEDGVATGDGERAKRPKAGHSEDLYCYCQKPGSGRMIGCDGADCKKQWFHFECAGRSLQEPADDEKWYCDDCIED